MGKNRSGYTLIEILVGLTLVGIIFGVGYIAFREFSRRQLINTTARALIGDLRLAQAEALDGTKPDESGCDDPDEILDGYNFYIDSSTSYVIQAKCSSAFGGGLVEIKRVTLTQNVTFENYPSQPGVNPIFFKALGHGNNIPSSTTLPIRFTALGLTGSVYVSDGGIIE